MEKGSVDILRALHEIFLDSLRRVFLAVSCDKERFETAYHIEHFLITHISHISCMEPAVHDGISCRLRILPISGHHVLTLDADLTLNSERLLHSVSIENLDFHRGNDLSRGSEDVSCRRVRRNDRCRLRKTISLVHRNTDGIIISLKVNIKKCTSADEELHVSAKSLTYSLEDKLIKQKHERLAEDIHELSAFIVSFLIVCNGILQSEVVEFLDSLALLRDRSLDALLEILGKCRNGKHHAWLELLNTWRNVSQSLLAGLS